MVGEIEYTVCPKKRLIPLNPSASAVLHVHIRMSLTPEWVQGSLKELKAFKYAALAFWFKWLSLFLGHTLYVYVFYQLPWTLKGMKWRCFMQKALFTHFTVVDMPAILGSLAVMHFEFKYFKFLAMGLKFALGVD